MTPAERWARILDLLAPIVEGDDGNLHRDPTAGFITWATAFRLLDHPMGDEKEKRDP